MMVNACSVDWRLLLEFVKAAGPIGAVVGVYLAARMGVRGFRQQKLLERRLDWYEVMLSGLMMLGVQFPGAAKSGNVKTARDLRRKLVELGEKGLSATAYADSVGYRAVVLWMSALMPVPEPGSATPVTSEEASLVQRESAKLHRALTDELRKDLRLKRLKGRLLDAPLAENPQG